MSDRQSGCICFLRSHDRDGERKQKRFDPTLLNLHVGNVERNNPVLHLSLFPDVYDKNNNAN